MERQRVVIRMCFGFFFFFFLGKVIMIRADLVLNRIKPVLFRDLKLYTFLRKRYKVATLPQANAPVGKGDGWTSEAQRMAEDVSIPAVML